MSDFHLEDGYTPKFGCLQPEELRFAASPAWDESNPVLPESQWREHDDYAQFNVPIKMQSYNNCTNASLAGLGETLFKAAGVEEVPALSMSFLYARNNGGRDQGAFCRDLADDFRKVGLPSAATWPESKIYLPREGVSKSVLDEAAKYEALEIYQCLKWEHVASALSLGFLVYHGFVLGQAFQRVGKDGLVPKFDGALANGHAMYSRGLTKKFGEWRTITPNSWGTNWGDRGVGYWDKSYFWAQKGNFINLDCFCVRAIKKTDVLPAAA